MGTNVKDVGTGTPSLVAPIGYTTGDGGAVTQITTINTGVTLHRTTGQITTVASTLAASASTSFVVTNNQVAATDTIVFSSTYAGAGTVVLFATNVTAGAFTLNIFNATASGGAALNAAIVINFAIIKAVAA